MNIFKKDNRDKIIKSYITIELVEIKKDGDFLLRFFGQQNVTSQLASLKEAFVIFLKNTRTTYTLFSSKGLTSSQEVQIIGDTESSLNEAFYMFNYAKKYLDLKKELLKNLNMTDRSINIDEAKMQISVKANHKEFTQIQNKLKELLARIESCTF